MRVSQMMNWLPWKKKRKSERKKRKQDQSLLKNHHSETGLEERVPRERSLAGWIATLLMERAATKPVAVAPEKNESDIQHAVPHLRLVKNEEEESLGERKEPREKDLSESTLSERWHLRKAQRRAMVRDSQKDLRFTLAITFLFVITFIVTALIDILT